jgi:site-specific DNA-methyltransferase (adenine-specific)
MAWEVEQIGDCTLYRGDCREILPTLGLVDAVVTDPPYGIDLDTDFSALRGTSEFNRKHGSYTGKHYAKIYGDDRPFDPTPWLQYPCILFGAQHYSSCLPAGGSWHVWDKREELKSNMLADFELIWTSFMSGPSRIIRHKWLGYMRRTEVGTHYHPTQKPVAVLQYLLSLLPITQHIILDPFMGSGPAGLACINDGRAFIGIEIEPCYFDIACKRIAQVGKQLSLSFPASCVQPRQEVLL